MGSKCEIAELLYALRVRDFDANYTAAEIYSGTSWGALPFPGVYSAPAFLLSMKRNLTAFTASYDYGSSIAENRLLTPKFAELKKQGIFLRSSPEFYKTDWVGNSSTAAVQVSNTDAFVVLLSNPDTRANFYIARQSDSTSRFVMSAIYANARLSHVH